MDPLRHVRLPLLKYLQASGERRVRVADEGKAAHTVFRLLARWERFSLLEAELRTGRTHQIRVHLAHLGYPIAGDEKYGDFALNKVLAREGLKRMFLHASRMRLPHPLDGGELLLEAALPAALKGFVHSVAARRGRIMARRFELLVFRLGWHAARLGGGHRRGHQCRLSRPRLPPPPEERARHVIGLGLRDALRHALPDLPEEPLPAAGRTLPPSLPGARSRTAVVRRRCRNDRRACRRRAICSPWPPARAAWGSSAPCGTAASAHFHASRCADECFSKPHPQMLEELLDELAVDGERALMIGDTTHDLQMANNAGVAGLAVAYGAHPAAALDACSRWRGCTSWRRLANGCGATPDLSVQPSCLTAARGSASRVTRHGTAKNRQRSPVRFRRSRALAYLNRCAHVRSNSTGSTTSSSMIPSYT
jgi:hypothetical protein